MCHLNVLSILDPDNVLSPVVILGIFSFRSVYGLLFQDAYLIKLSGGECFHFDEIKTSCRKCVESF